MDQKQTLDEAINNAVEISAMTRLKWYGLNTLVLILAIALLYWRTNLDILCPGVFMFFLGFCVLAVIQIFIKNKLVWLRTSFVLITVMSVLYVGGEIYRTSAKELFRTHVIDPIPPSVKILDSYYYGGIDTAVFLHFTMDPDIFQKILVSEHFQIKEESAIKPSDQYISIAPSWWNPGVLKNPALYKWDDEDKEGFTNNVVWIWVNDTKTEVYFAHLNL